MKLFYLHKRSHDIVSFIISHWFLSLLSKIQSLQLFFFIFKMYKLLNNLDTLKFMILLTEASLLQYGIWLASSVSCLNSTIFSHNHSKQLYVLKMVFISYKSFQIHEICIFCSVSIHVSPQSKKFSSSYGCIKSAGIEKSDTKNSLNIYGIIGNIMCVRSVKWCL